MVDHYAIDEFWEEALAAHYRQLLVIDDLADRPHKRFILLSVAEDLRLCQNALLDHDPENAKP